MFVDAVAKYYAYIYSPQFGVTCLEYQHDFCASPRLSSWGCM